MAQMVMEIIPLKHSRPEEMVSGIREILAGEGRVAVIQNKLVVRATPQKLDQIKNLLRQIDTRLQNLRITVKQGVRQDIDRNDRSLSADVEVGSSGRIRAGANRGSTGAAPRRASNHRPRRPFGGEHPPTSRSRSPAGEVPQSARALLP